MVAELVVSQTELDNLESVLLNRSGKVPLHNRFRALFTLKALKNEDAIRIISKGFADPSALLKHELAYCLGQIKNEAALPTLNTVLADESEDPMVRHEAAEAMGAISAISALPILKKYSTDPNRAVRETCEIALAKIEWDHSEEGRRHHSQQQQQEEIPVFTSIDPAPPTSGLLAGKPKPQDLSQATISELQSRLLDTKLPLFERYRAMFALRNIGTPEAVDALAAGFTDDSALFKHEIAFVFGQLLSPHSVPSLIKVLQNNDESDMVRHEAAEALGGIATPEVFPHLKEYMTRDDAPVVVKESCQVALDMFEYENSDQFQYADGLETHAVTTVDA
ncbi:deoxyhypusine hydroxylase [Dentipellis sp. KUC8613]|nr:deoxyhypusine hydroxylase [Dentipellis sp. KUC8613]